MALLVRLLIIYMMRRFTQQSVHISIVCEATSAIIGHFIRFCYLLYILTQLPVCFPLSAAPTPSPFPEYATKNRYRARLLRLLIHS